MIFYKCEALSYWKTIGSAVFRINECDITIWTDGVVWDGVSYHTISHSDYESNSL